MKTPKKGRAARAAKREARKAKRTADYLAARAASDKYREAVRRSVSALLIPEGIFNA